MKKVLKKATPFLLASLLLAGGSSVWAKSPFDDMENHWAAENVEDANVFGIFKGYNGKFHPQKNMTRAEFITAMVRTMEYPLIEKGNFSFSDVEEGKWYHPYIQTAIQQGLIQPSDFQDQFKPNQPISRGEMARIISRAVSPYLSPKADFTKKQFKDITPTSLFGKEVYQVAGYGVITGYKDGTFQANQNATRAEASAMVMRSLRTMNQQGPMGIKYMENKFDDNPNGIRLPVMQFIQGARQIYNYEKTTDLSALAPFASEKARDKLESQLTEFQHQFPKDYLHLTTNHVIPTFISRHMAIAESESFYFIKSKRNSNPYEGELVKTSKIKWYLTFENGMWKIEDVEGLEITPTWKMNENYVSDAPFDLEYKITDLEGKEYHGVLPLNYVSDQALLDNAKEIVEQASPHQVTFYAIGYQELAQTKWASAIQNMVNRVQDKSLSNPFHVVFYDSAFDETHSIWVEEKNMGYFSYYALNGDVHFISINEVPWQKLWNHSVWSELVQNESEETIATNGLQYGTKIKQAIIEQGGK